MKLIALCLGPLDETRSARIRELAAGVEDWDEFFRLTLDRHVSSLCWFRIKQAGASALVAGPVAGGLEDLYVRTALANAVRLKRMLKVSDALRSAGVGLLYFKGASLLLRGAYPDLGCRIMSDVDVLGRPEDRDKIEAAFVASGEWKRLYDHAMQEWLVSVWGDASGNLVEAHWNLKPDNGAAPGAAEARLWKHAVEVEYRGSLALVPAWEDCLIQTALHGTAHHYFDVSYLYPGMADLAQIAARAGDLDWDRLIGDLRSERMLEHAAAAVGLARTVSGSAAAGQLADQLDLRCPDLAGVTGPLVAKLATLAAKPWLFQSFHERRLLAPKSAGGWARYIYYALRRRFSFAGMKRRADPGRERTDQARLTLKYPSKFRDPDFWRYLWALYRFDRKIGFQFFTGPKASRRHEAGDDI